MIRPVTAISVHLDWIGKPYVWLTSPKTLTKADAQTIVDRFEDTILLDTEDELLETFLQLIDDADVMSGWNSEGFDIYMVNRIARVPGKEHTRRFCLWGKYPTDVSLNVMAKHKKHMTQWVDCIWITWNCIASIHTTRCIHTVWMLLVNMNLVNAKQNIQGTLDQLYNNDFETFITYSRQDVDLLVRMDKKLQFIDLANVIAHDNTVLVQTTMGAVAVTDQLFLMKHMDVD